MNKITLSRSEATLVAEPRKFKKGNLKEQGVEYPFIKVTPENINEVRKFVGEEQFIDWVQSRFNQVTQQAWRNSVGWSEEIKAPTKEFDEQKFKTQIESGTVRGETMEDMKEKMDDLMEEMTALADLPKTPENYDKAMKLITEIGTLKANINERSELWKARRAGKPDEEATQVAVNG